jgi:hypothetical protein
MQIKMIASPLWPLAWLHMVPQKDRVVVPGVLLLVLRLAQAAVFHSRESLVVEYFPNRIFANKAVNRSTRSGVFGMAAVLARARLRQALSNSRQQSTNLS